MSQLRSSCILLSVSAFLMLVLALPAFGQGFDDIESQIKSDENKTESISREKAKLIVSELYGIDIKNKWFQKTFDGNIQEGEVDKGIIHHFRFDDGIDLPTSEEIESSFVMPEIKPEDYEQVRKMYEENIRIAQKEFGYTKNLPKCKANKTREVLVDSKGNQVKLDALFASQDLLSNFESSVFGRNTSVYQYDSSNTAHAYITDSFSLKCLPSRVRTADAYVYIYEGRDALKNYDEKKQGKFDKQVFTVINSLGF